MVDGTIKQAPTVLIVLLILSGGLSVYLSAWAQFRKRVTASFEFSLMMLSIAIYSFGYTIEISRSDLKGILDAIRFEYIGLSFISVLSLLFVIRYIYEKPFKPYIWGIFMVIPLITLVMVFTVEYHDLFYIHPRVVDGGFFPIIKFEKGIWYYVQYAFNDLIGISVIVQLIIYACKSDKRKMKQVISLIFGTLFPFAGSILFVWGYIPGNVDPGPFFFAITGSIFGWALFRLGLFELVPLARELAVDSIRDAFIVIDKHGRVQDINNAGINLSGTMDLKIGEYIPGDSPLREKAFEMAKDREGVFEFSKHNSSTGDSYYLAKVYPINKKHHNTEGMAVLVSDITETKILMEQLQQQASIDDLTGVYSRRHLVEYGIREIELSKRNKQPVGVIMVDLDYFKKINDSYGHLAGDEVLKNAAKCFLSGTRKTDIIGRYGGEEFAIICPNSDIINTCVIAERLRNILAQSVVLYEGVELSITASFGVYSIANEDGNTTLDYVFHMADNALYKAKREGRNRVCKYEAIGDE